MKNMDEEEMIEEYQNYETFQGGNLIQRDTTYCFVCMF